MNNVFINADYMWDIPAININISYSAGVQIIKDICDAQQVAHKIKKCIELMRPELTGGIITAFRYDIITRTFIVTYCHSDLKATDWREQLPMLRLEPLQKGEQPFNLPVISNPMIYDIPWREGYAPMSAHTNNPLPNEDCQPIIKLSSDSTYNHSE